MVLVAPGHGVLNGKSIKIHNALLHSQPLEHCVDGVGVETGLELREEFAGDGGDVADAGHWKQDPFASGVFGDLHGLGKVFDRHEVSAQAHVSEDHHLRLDWFAQDRRAERGERRQGHGRGRSAVVQLDDVKVIVVLAWLDRGTDPAGVGAEVVEADLDRLLGSHVLADSGHLQSAVAWGYLGFDPI